VFVVGSDFVKLRRDYYNELNERPVL
jgi:hypothetical protein